MPPPPTAQPMDDPELIYRLTSATDKAREKAKAKAEACMQLQAFLDQGFNYQVVQAGAATAKNVSNGTQAKLSAPKPGSGKTCEPAKFSAIAPHFRKTPTAYATP